MDPVVATYVYQDRPHFLLYVLMAATGSALGSIVIYGIGYAGGEGLLRKRISPERFDKFHQAFQKHPFLEPYVARDAAPTDTFQAIRPGCSGLRDAVQPLPAGNFRRTLHRFSDA